MKNDALFIGSGSTEQQSPAGSIPESTKMSITAIAGSAVDDYGNTVATSGTLAMGGSVLGNIEEAGDHDWFKVSLGAGETYTFSLSQTTNGLADPYLVLYDSNGALVTENDDTGSSADSQIVYLASLGGAYYLSAQGFDQETGTYTLAAARTVVDDYGSTADTSADLPMSGSIAGDIEIAGDTDWFKVGLIAGETYTFSLSQTTNGLTDPYLELYDPNSKLVARNDNSGDSSTDSKIVYFADFSGTYYLSARGSNAEVGAYTLAATKIVDDYGNTATTSGTLAMGGAIVGNIEVIDDEDWFKVELDAGEYYAFSLTQMPNGLTDPYLELYDANGTLVAENASRIAYSSGLGGTYFLSARGNNTQTGAYTLAATKIVDDYGSTATASAALAIGDSVVGMIEVAGDQDWFNVNLDAGEMYGFSLTRMPDGLTATPSLGLYDASGTLVAANDRSGNSADVRIAYSAGLGGIYYLSAQGYDVETGAYTLAATKIVDDYGNTATTSRALTMGGSVAGNIEIAGDQDWFKVNLMVGESYKFSLDKTANGLTDPYLALYDASGNLVAENDDGSNGVDSQIIYSANLSGTYYVSARGNDVGTGAYVLSAVKNATGTTVLPSYTVPGTLGNDFFIPSGGNNYLGGGGSDSYIISSHTLSGTVTARIIDTEGANMIQLTDGLTIASSSFYSNATQLTLSNGAKVQILGAAAFSYGVGANVLVGDTASSLTYAQFASMLGASVPITGSTPVSGMLNYQVPTGTSAAIQMVDVGIVGVGVSLTGVNGLNVSHESGMLII